MEVHFIIKRILDMGFSPVSIILNNNYSTVAAPNYNTDGIVDSLRSMMMCENFLKPYSDEHFIVRLLTSAFNNPMLYLYIVLFLLLGGF